MIVWRMYWRQSRSRNILEKVKKHLMDQGAKGALMSGSGPTIFAIFEDKKTADDAMESLRSIEDIKQAYVVRPIQ